MGTGTQECGAVLLVWKSTSETSVIRLYIYMSGPKIGAFTEFSVNGHHLEKRRGRYFVYSVMKIMLLLGDIFLFVLEPKNGSELEHRFLETYVSEFVES
ncbi:hypothetical protein AVEN_211882-1 [Araneus ventricosus]|uniref:Uncharacterized protein n=1 Tax=Araneus ventricosus TaxID=182803 RepID=A0A4Y2F2M4_ARAVE|nr:hypothetical protein AVEN_211882-1 [Araneus ventricosus]